jgi:hypothetical protein
MPKRERGLAVVVEEFVTGLELEGAEDVLGRVAVELAQALEEAPGYSKARLAHELRECVDGLQRRAGEVEEMRARRARRAEQNEREAERKRVLAAAGNGG